MIENDWKRKGKCIKTGPGGHHVDQIGFAQREVTIPISTKYGEGGRAAAATITMFFSLCGVPIYNPDEADRRFFIYFTTLSKSNYPEGPLILSFPAFLPTCPASHPPHLPTPSPAHPAYLGGGSCL